VPVGLVLSPDGRSVTVTPAQLLASTTNHAFLFHGIADPAGNVMPDAHIDFATVDEVPPTIDVLYAGVPIVDGQKFAAGIDWNFKLDVKEDGPGGGPAIQVTRDGQVIPVAAGGAFVLRWTAADVGALPVLVVTAKDASGNVGTFQRTLQVTGDSAPTVQFVQPTAAVSVEEGGSVPVSLSASDNSQVARLELRLDGAPYARVSRTI